MATTETAQVTEDGRVSPLLMSQSKCWLPTDGTNLIGWPQAPPGSPGSLWLHPPTEYLFKSWTLFCCTNLTSNITSPSSPFLSCSLITRSPPPPSVILYFSFEAETRKLRKRKKKSLRKHLSSLTKTQRTILSWFFFIIIILFQCDMSFHHEILQSCYGCEQREKKPCEMGLCPKTIFN